ncbi:MAG: hypothetical protein ACREQQ_07815 [Candidatus Binatia bacterium]
MNWASTYFPLYRRERRSWIVSEWMDDSAITTMLGQADAPFLLVTEPHDRAQLERVERVTNSRLRLELLHHEGAAQVYLARLEP